MFTRGGLACLSYGDLTVGRWFLSVMNVDRWRRFGQLAQPGGGHRWSWLGLSSLVGADGAILVLDLARRRRGRSRIGGIGERHWCSVTDPS